MASTILILALFGIVAILLELVLPGGVLGVAGGLCLVAASALSFIEFGFSAGLAITIGLGVLALLLFRLWMKYFHRLPGTRQLVLLGKNSRGDARPEGDAALAGKVGTALTEIAPSGKAVCDDERFDVIAESNAIPKGSPVAFIRRSGPGWVVRLSE